MVWRRTFGWEDKLLWSQSLTPSHSRADVPALNWFLHDPFFIMDTLSEAEFSVEGGDFSELRAPLVLIPIQEAVFTCGTQANGTYFLWPEHNTVLRVLLLLPYPHRKTVQSCQKKRKSSPKLEPSTCP